MRGLLFAAVLLLASTVQAQPVVNPTLLEFTVSPDHNTTAIDPTTGASVNVVASYDWSAVGMGGVGAIAATVGLGKPVATTGALIQMPMPGLALITIGATYTGTVVAKGPGGTAPSLPSNPFVVAGAVKVPAPATNVKVKTAAGG